MNQDNSLDHQLDLMINYLQRKRELLEQPSDEIIDLIIKELRDDMTNFAEKSRYNYEEWMEGCAYPEYWKEKSKEEFQEKREEWIENAIKINKGIIWIIKSSSLSSRRDVIELDIDLEYYEKKMEEFKKLEEKIKGEIQ